MRKILLFIFSIASISIFAFPWGHRYDVEQANQNITVDVGESFTVSVEWGEGGWDAQGSKFGYGLSTDGSDWTWIEIPWFEDGSGSNKRCKASLSIATPGKYYYAYRMDKSGTSYSFGSSDWLENDFSLNAVSYIDVGDFTISDGNWSTGATWNSGSKPSSGDNVGIYHNITLDEDATVDMLYIYTSKSLDVSVGKGLTVGNVLTNLGTLTLKSTSGGTGSLIASAVGTITGDITVERYIAGYSGAGNGWHLISSPVTEFNISGSDFEPINGSDDLYSWNEQNHKWINYFDDSGNGGQFTKITPGLGYLCSYNGTDIRSFKSPMQIENITWSNQSYSGGGIDDDWHLFGNPFAAALNVITYPNGDWNVTAFSTPEIYDELGGNYIAVNLVDYIIPAMQGFFVQATNATNSITIPASARIHDHDHNWYKSEKTNLNSVQFKITNTNNEFKDMFLIGFSDEATNLFDVEFDARKLAGDASAPQLYSVDETGDKYCVNYLKEDQNSRVVNLMFRPGTTGEHTIEIMYNNLELLDQVYLEDTFENQMIDLSSLGSYTFHAEVGDAEDRFKLVFGATGINEIQKESLQAYMSGDQLYILGEEGQATLTVYDIQGKQLFNEQVELNSQFRQSLDLPQGIYVVSVQGNQVVKTAKVIIK